jgi:RNA polymerase sigma-70 factor, ECF subfamily
MNEPPGEVTALLARVKRGDQDAMGKLMPLVYRELRRLAGHYMRGERPGHTLQPTAVVHEAYLRLTGLDHLDWQNRAQFMGVAAQMMRRILLNYARQRVASKRGGVGLRTELEVPDNYRGKGRGNTCRRHGRHAAQRTECRVKPRGRGAVFRRHVG